jgi:hypothetical protein
MKCDEIGNGSTRPSMKSYSRLLFFPLSSTIHTSCRSLNENLRISRRKNTCPEDPAYKRQKRVNKSQYRTITFSPTANLEKMSSDAAVLAPIFTNIPNKRKSDASSEAVSKKPRKDASSAAGHDAAKGLLKQYLKDGESFIPGDASTDDLRGLLLSVTKYAAYLETQASVAAHSKPAAGPAPKAKTREQLEELGEKLRKAARSQIKKQMTVRYYFLFDRVANVDGGVLVETELQSWDC